MKNKLIADLKKSKLSLGNSPSKYESFIKEIQPGIKYESSNTRVNMPGSVTFPIPNAQSSVDCSLAGYWITSIVGNNAYALNQDVDDQCGYITSYTLTNNTASYQKFDSSGTEVFSKYQTTGSGQSGLSEIMSDSEGNYYVCYNDGIRKIDTLGSIVWEKYFEDVLVYGVSVNSLGEVFVNGDKKSDQSHTKCIAKLNSQGDVIAQKEVTIPLASNIYTYNGTKIDSQNNVIWSIIISTYNEDNAYSNLFLKLDSDLNVIWDTRLDPTNQIADFDVTEFALDSNDNLYANHYYVTVAKYDSNGDFVWARALSSSLQSWYVNCRGLGASKNGDVFFLGSDSKNNIESGANVDVFYITKMNTDGDLDFISYISGSGINDADWDWAQAMTSVKNNTLNVCFRSQNTSNFAKLPLTQVANGTYGDFTFVDITNNPNLELQAFTNTSRIATAYNITTSTLFNTTKSKVYEDQTATGLSITKTTI